MSGNQKVALVLGFSGSGYYGFQLQASPSHPTLELELSHALSRTGALPQGAQPGSTSALSRVYWSRASRTDKGVSAAANVASLLVPAHIANSLESWKDALNAALPSSIRVWGAVIVPRHFDARACCVGRRYEYLLPVWALDPTVGVPRAVAGTAQVASQSAPAQAKQQPAVQSAMLNMQHPGHRHPAAAMPTSMDEASVCASRGCTAASTTAQDEGAAALMAGSQTYTQQAAAAKAVFASSCGSRNGNVWPQGSASDRARGRALSEAEGSTWQLSALELRRLNLILGVYVGTHCYHNFTCEAYDEPQQAQRTIRSAYCEGPVYLSSDVATQPHAATDAMESAPGSVAATSTCTDATNSCTADVKDSAGLLARSASSQQPCAYVRIVLYGDGFLMHMIRKMVGLAVAVARKAAPPACIRAALDPGRKVAVPTAPACGLIMGCALYDMDTYLAMSKGSVPMATRQIAATASCNAQRPNEAPQQLDPAATTLSEDVPAAELAVGGSACRAQALIAASASVPSAAIPGQSHKLAGTCMPASAGQQGPAAHVQALHSVASGEDVRAFKEACLYGQVAACDVLALWLFLNGLNEAAFRFSTWIRKPTSEHTAQVASPDTDGICPPASKRRALSDGRDVSARVVGGQEHYGLGSPRPK